APASQRLRRVLARRPTPKVLVDEENLGRREARVVERMLLAYALESGAIVLEGMLSQAVEGYSAQKTCWDDAIGIDVVAAQWDAPAGDRDASSVVHVISLSCLSAGLAENFA